MSAPVRAYLDYLNEAASLAEETPLYSASGRLVRASGLVLETVGLKLSVGSSCLIEAGSLTVEAEVVGFSETKLFLMPLADAHGLEAGARVFPMGFVPSPPVFNQSRARTTISEEKGRLVPVGQDLLGRVVDALGQPLDGLGAIHADQRVNLTTPPFNPMERALVRQPLDVGVRCINALLTVGRGQRLGLFAGSGLGKSVLLGMMARYTEAEIVIVGLIGERGREVKDFIENILGEEGRRRAVVVAAPADAPPLLRLHGASYATRLAEYFRDQGRHVLLIMDSLTRYAMAQREIALAIGEPPATKGYPPSVFARLPRLVERAGNGVEQGGSITAFYTVLSEGDDQQDPVADNARAILDGHIVLTRQLSDQGHYPAIDIEQSISRVMNDLIPAEALRETRQFKYFYSRYQRNRDLINVGAYSKGADPILDRAIALFPEMEAFLQQGIHECARYEPSRQQLSRLAERMQ